MASELEAERERARRQEHKAAVRDGYFQAALTGVLAQVRVYNPEVAVQRANEIADLAMKNREIHFTPGSRPL